jgi:hypothetical protein
MTTGFTATTKKEQPIFLGSSCRLTPKHPTSWRIGGVRFNRMKLFLWDTENGPSLNRELKLPMLLETGIQSSCFDYSIHINVLQRKYEG